MSQPDTTEQILQSHTGLIHRVVMHCNNPGSVPDLEQVLQQAEENDWKQLVVVIRNIMSGTREESVLLGLDEEDRVIAESILRGLQDPQTLPGTMAKQMLAAGGDMGILAGRIRPLVEGERDTDKLTEKMFGHWLKVSAIRTNSPRRWVRKVRS